MRCDPYMEVYRCRQRDLAVRIGEMRWLGLASHGRESGLTGGWVWPVPAGGPPRGALFRWTFCPFCGEPLARPKEAL